MDNSYKSKETTVKPSDNKNSSDVYKKQVVEDNETEPTSDVNVSKTVKNANTDNESTAETNRVETDTAANQAILEKVSGELESTVESNLHISKEEFDEIMAELGFTVLDLLNSDNLKQFVLQMNGSNDITEVLTDENLANSIQNLLQKVDELQLGKEFQMSNEELADWIKNYQMNNLTNESNKIVETDSNHNFAEVKTPVQTEILQNAGLTDEINLTKSVVTDNSTVNDNAKEIPGEKEIPIEVHKLTGEDNEKSAFDSTSSDQKNAELDMPTQLETLINNLAVAGNENGQNFTEMIANVRQMQEITNQIVEQIKVFIKPDQTSMELQLNPEHLGKISLSVSEKDGIVTAQFTTQTQIAKEAIESQMQVLKDNLSNQGLKVESIEVTVSEFSFDQSNQAASEQSQQSQQNHSQRHNIFRDDSEIFNSQQDNETIAADILEQSGNQIDFTA
jgi:flagellar hook-length control protein FliK